MSKVQKPPDRAFLLEINSSILPSLIEMKAKEDAHRVYLIRRKAPLDWIRRSEIISRMIEISYTEYVEYLKKWTHLI